MHSRDESEVSDNQYALNMVSVVPTSIFGLSICSKLGSLVLQVDLENTADNSSFLSLSLQEIDIWYVQCSLQINVIFPFMLYVVGSGSPVLEFFVLSLVIVIFPAKVGKVIMLIK